MKLEQIDTSTTEGKAEVMLLAAKGRGLAANAKWRCVPQWEAFSKGRQSKRWAWDEYDYAIIAEPVGPEEVYVVIGDWGIHSALVCKEHAEDFAPVHGFKVQRYVRAD